MTTKNLVVLTLAACALGGAAWMVTHSSRVGAPRLNGTKILPAFDVSSVQSLAIGDKIKIAASTNGWCIESFQNYPADHGKIVENLLKLQDLKVGQVVRGKTLSEVTEITVRDGAGGELAKLSLGPRHEKWGHGRYAKYRDQTVLVSETLDDFGTDPKRWCETKIVDTPYISFADLADPALTEAELGFATGVVASVTIDGVTNRVATIGNTVKGSSNRYLKLDNNAWTYIVPSYAVESLLPKPPAAEEKTDETTSEAESEVPAEDAKEEVDEGASASSVEA